MSVGLSVPTLLALDGDDFMDVVGGALAADDTAAAMAALVATPKSYAEPLPGERAAPTPKVLKLYQPVHGRFQLVTASLVCQLAGLPDHRVGSGELCGFVLRRLVTEKDGTHEYGWVKDPAPLAQSGAWVRTSTGALALSADEVPREEEVIPTFPLRWMKGGRVRTLRAGLIPTASRETRLGAPLTQTGELPSRRAVLEMQLRGRVFDPLLGVLERLGGLLSVKEREAASEQIPWILADLWQVLSAEDAFGPLGTEAHPSVSAADLRGVLGASFLFRVRAHGAASIGLTSLWSAMFSALAAVPALVSGTFDGQYVPVAVSRDRLEDTVIYGGEELLEKILDALPSARKHDPPKLSRVPRLQGGDDVQWVVRMVYRRKRCDRAPETVISEPSARFVLAGYHDPDAPARELRIPLPGDVSIGALRRARKGVGFVISPDLQQQMKRITPLKDLLEGKLEEGGGLTFAEICSFSIPIITICAMIVLMIFVMLLNIVFW